MIDRKEIIVESQIADKGISAIDLMRFEEEIKDCFLRGEIRTPVHLSGGNEDQLIGIFRQIKPEDWVFSTYRSHYHALLKGIPAGQIKEDILKGKSMHIFSQEHRFFTSSIVGGCLPIALGVAMAIQRKELRDWVWVFVGDMAAETGGFHECYKYACWHNLPITFIIEDNGFSVNTPTKEVWGLGALLSPSNQRAGIVSRKRITYERIYPHSGTGTFVWFK